MLRRHRFRKIKKDYQNKNLQNPFFHQKKKKGSGRRFFKWFLLLVIFLIILGIWFFLASDVWRIKKINIVGLTRVASSEVENPIWEQTKLSRGFIFRQSNLFLFDKDEAAKLIMNSYNFASLNISRRLPGTLEVKVGERPYAFIFQQGTNFYYSSSDGSLIKDSAVLEADKQKYFILENKNSLNLIDDKNKIIIKDDYLQFIINLAAQLTNYPDQPVERYIIDQEFNTVKVKFLNGPLVYFNIKADSAGQINRLLLVKKEKIKDNFSKTNYIDLRYGDRIFINPEFK